jgi:AraC family transcriptional regulator
MLEGSFDLAFRGRPSYCCDRGVVFIEPAGETHCNCMGCQGAWVLAIQPDPVELENLLPRAGFLDAPSVRQAAPAGLLARRVARELRSPDAFSGLMIEGLAAELLALAGRTRAQVVRPSKTPGWLERVHKAVEGASPGRVTLSQLAQTAGVHVTHLNRQFRARYGKSAGRYLLEHRLEWAAAQLSGGTQPIAEIACLAGFADQSHFTRRFRDYTGLTPGRYRSVARGARLLSMELQS